VAPSGRTLEISTMAAGWLLMTLWNLRPIPQCIFQILLSLIRCSDEFFDVVVIVFGQKRLGTRLL